MLANVKFVVTFRTVLRRTDWIVPCLLALFLVAGTLSLLGDSATFDETAHLPAGLTYLDRLDFRLNPEHPPLSKAWAALPLWLGGLARPDYDSAAWQGRPDAENPATRTGADQWIFGYELINGPRKSLPRREPDSLLVPARLAMLLLGAALLCIIYFWSREIWGRRGALFSLFVAALSPTLLAHSRLVTTDLPSALAFAAVLWTFWRFCARASWQRAALCGLCFGAALLVKFSALLLAPILALLGLLWVGWPGLDHEQRRLRLRRLIVAGLIVAAVGYAGLWAGYGFRFAATGPEYSLDWSAVGMQEGSGAAIKQFVLRTKAVPEGYLYGLAHFLGGAGRRVAFLNGEQSIVGWWYYFPETFLLKSPPALLLLLGWLGIEAAQRRRWISFRAWFLLLPVGFYLGVSIAGNLNIGHRHLVPLYPLLFVLGGALPGLLRKTRASLALFIVLACGFAISFGFATPRYLSYFNIFAGGANGGRHYLLDSNIDWGQDLARLQRWMERNGVDEIDLAYFGTADPAAHGIRYRKVYMVHDFNPGTAGARPESGRYVAVSANLLEGLYFDHDRAFAEALHRRGSIDMERIRVWIALRDRLSKANRRHPDFASWAVSEGIIDPTQRQRIEATLLTGWFRRLREERTPIAVVGDSIFVYKL